MDASKPGLVFFHSRRSGPSRQTEGHLAQVLQRRNNHATFELYRVAQEEHPEVHERFNVHRLPTLCVIEGKRVRRTLEAPKGAREIHAFLADWLK